MKTCIQCNNEKPLVEFYAHPRMSDGRLNKCKPCCIAYAKMRRVEHPEIVRAIERKKAIQPSRKQWRFQYQKTIRQRHPEKYKARTMVSNALKRGQIIRGKCVRCGSENTQAHHPDYNQPLNVVWVCFQHHMEIHRQTTQTF